MRAQRLAILGLAASTACVGPLRRSPYPIDRAGARTVVSLADSVSQILQAGVRDSAFPAAIAVVGTASGVVLTSTAGRLDWNGGRRPDASTLWDLASLTKVIGLTSGIMLLVERGQLDLDAPVQQYLPAWTGPDQERVTIRHLLTHSSGLPAWRPLYKESESPEGAIALALSTPLDTVPGARMVYSDLGAILLGQVVAAVSGRPLDRFLREEVFAPLGMNETQFRPPSRVAPRVAPTEIDPWRGRHLRGEVHDENAFALGGVSGHAGLFSSARDLVRVARMYLGNGELDRRRFLSPATISEFTRIQDPTLSHRALGWEKPNGTNSAGRFLSASAFGHTGFTGTSIWIDPERGLFVVLLTNRVNPTRERRQIAGVRTAVADAVFGRRH